MTKSLSGTNDTGRGNGCPCGRSHPDTRPYRLRINRPGSHDRISEALSEGYASGKASGNPQRGEHVLHYAGNCKSPISIKKAAERGALHVTWEVRCRKCGPCLRAKVGYWALAAIEQTRLAAEQGLRSWFGTLTLSPESQRYLRDLAEEKWLAEQPGAATASPAWMHEPECDYRFALVLREFLALVQKYWKRLRKAGHKFKYFLVFERHKSGLPHAHFILHEMEDRILKRALQSQWPHGFTNVKLIGGKSFCPNKTPERAAFYVAKYLGKTVQSRQIASRGYRPSRRRMLTSDLSHSPKGVKKTRPPLENTTSKGTEQRVKTDG